MNLPHDPLAKSLADFLHISTLDSPAPGLCFKTAELLPSKLLSQSLSYKGLKRLDGSVSYPAVPNGRTACGLLTKEFAELASAF